MAASNSMVTGLVVLVVVLVLVYLVDPTFFGLIGGKAGFQNGPMNMPVSTGMAAPGQMSNSGSVDLGNTTGNPNAAPSESVQQEAFNDMANFEGPAEFGSAQAPAGCYPRDQLVPSELLPKDNNSVWAEQNPMGPGSLKGKNFLSAGSLLGVNTVGQSLRNANWQLRSEPPNPQVPVSIFNQSTIQPDVNRRPLEIN